MVYRQLGDYTVESHLETPECSLRVLKVTRNKAVQPHHHHKTTQTYFVINGTAHATIGDETSILRRYQILRVPVDTVHSIRSEEGATLLSISIPPLEASDQHVAAES